SCTSTSACVKKRKICVKRLRSWGESFCAQSRQSSPSGTSSGIQWICCWRFQYSNAQGYSNGLYCLLATRRGMSGSFEMLVGDERDCKRAEDEEDGGELVVRTPREALGGIVGVSAGQIRAGKEALRNADRHDAEVKASKPGRRRLAAGVRAHEDCDCQQKADPHGDLLAASCPEPALPKAGLCAH